MRPEHSETETKNYETETSHVKSIACESKINLYFLVSITHVK